MFINFTPKPPQTNKKITKPPFPYIILTICFSYMPFRLIVTSIYIYIYLSIS